MMSTARPSYDQYFMEIATIVASRSTCLRRHVGALIVKDNHLLSTGYNGPPKGMEQSACYCGIFDTAYIEAYMKVEPYLLCIRVPDLTDGGAGPRCIHMWTYNKLVINNIPDDIKALIPDT